MPLPGGAADKIGNRYEGLWTVNCLIDVLSEKADSIKLEPPGEERKGIEFWLKKKEVIEYHQVKRQQSTSEAWKISQLKDVLINFRERLQNPNAKCVLVSTNNCPTLQELIERAKNAQTYKQFQEFFLTSKKLKSGFEQIHKYWEKFSIIEEDTFTALKDINIEIISEDSLKHLISDKITFYIDCEEENVDIFN
jgi:hypothetical protein